MRRDPFEIGGVYASEESRISSFVPHVALILSNGAEKYDNFIILTPDGKVKFYNLIRSRRRKIA